MESDNTSPRNKPEQLPNEAPLCTCWRDVLHCNYQCFADLLIPLGGGGGPTEGAS